MAVAAAFRHHVPNGIGLVAVGDDGQTALQDPDRVVDDEGGVRHFALVKGPGADAVFGLLEDPVAAVLTAAHDKVGDDRLLSLRVHQAALDYGVKVTGATVHYASEVVDGGEIILQKAVDVLPGDTPEILQKRVMEQAEWVILPQAAELVAARIVREKE